MAASTKVVYARNLRKIAYVAALEAQNTIARRHLDDIRVGRTETAKNMLLFCEHFPVFTIGIRSKAVNAEEKAKLQNLGAEFHHTKRGGLVTFHGPGQLVCYPVLNLAYFKKSVRWYVACLEKTLIETCKRFDVEATTTCDTGVWVKDNKIAAIGIRVGRWITTHGISLNCNTDLSWFEHFTPCGIIGKGVTSLSIEKNRTVAVSDVIPVFTESFQKVFDCKVIQDSQENLAMNNSTYGDKHP